MLAAPFAKRLLMGDPVQCSRSGVFLISPTSSSSLLIPSGTRAAAAQRRGQSCCWHREDTKRGFPVSRGAQLSCAVCGLVWVTDQLVEMQQNMYPLPEAQPPAPAPGDLMEEGRSTSTMSPTCNVYCYLSCLKCQCRHWCST